MVGKEYTSLSTKKKVPAKEMRRDCGPGCRFKCLNKVTEIERAQFYAEYYSTPTRSRKYDYLARHITEKISDKKEGTIKLLK